MILPILARSKTPCAGGNLLRMVRMVVMGVTASLLIGLPSTLVRAEQSAPPKREPPRAFDHFEVTFLPPNTAATSTPKAISKLWQHVVFSKTRIPNQFSETCLAGRQALQITSQKGGSGLVWLHPFNPHTTPWLQWEWRVAALLPNSDLRQKNRSDTPIRIFILFLQSKEDASFLDNLVFQNLKRQGRHFPGESVPQAVLTYVWAKHLPLGKVAPSPYSKRVRFIPLERGATHIATWRKHQQNIAQDYQKAYQAPLPKRAMLALAADTDNTQSHSTSWVANLTLSHSKQPYTTQAPHRCPAQRSTSPE